MRQALRPCPSEIRHDDEKGGGMTFTITSQSAVEVWPVTKSFETRDEADDYIALRRKEVEEARIYFKIEPTLEVMQ